jgi:predicted DNA-binding transcriptional regulator AlpA
MADQPILRAPDRSHRKRQLLSNTAPISTKRDQGISTEPAGDSRGIEGDKCERRVDEFSGAQAVAGVPRWSTSAEEPQRKRRRSTPLAQTPRDYLNRVELLTLVPLSMSSIDNLEKGGVFPSRFRLEPTTRVAWKRREVEKWLAERACKRVHQATTVDGGITKCVETRDRQRLRTTKSEKAVA